jgi:hypothetical protein
MMKLGQGDLGFIWIMGDVDSLVNDDVQEETVSGAKQTRNGFKENRLILRYIHLF